MSRHARWTEGYCPEKKFKKRQQFRGVGELYPPLKLGVSPIRKNGQVKIKSRKESQPCQSCLGIL